MINEYFYTKSSQESAKHFSDNQEDFLLYHKGFQSQIKKWSEKPIDIIINEISNNQIYKNAVIADLGCGDGLLYENFQNENKKKIYSFDLCSHKDFIQVADSRNIPLENEFCDVVVFCLALMGTNYIEFLTEAKRLLKQKGHLMITEVNSRITNMDLFIQMIENLGFKLVRKNVPNSYFCFLIFLKISDLDQKNHTLQTKVEKLNQIFIKSLRQKFPREHVKNLLQVSQILLKPCIYKKR
ncbi:ribosomal RNA processing protein, putative [Ichthyophthirius multifiliis]|uniref:Ribosomal RNA-processing protein 8 n=1 Tax=Ichthyophthirius multifiliis TaxID=5932 RepID=G0QW50_ICHMU|nr:ribosomal RNA processing protein, putative [Ichthyophthirius multifiliis]EGR30553.1 ribosomal RNA processing protein, putative [Ichthyophthirius multifiliis]|eukprot:XP_004032140.1 ribosomal RNA processing protein, putative [Ichthyophthirius multifiliis]